MIDLTMLTKEQLLSRMELIGQNLSTAYGRDDRSDKLIEGAIELATGESQEEFLRRVLKEGRY